MNLAENTNAARVFITENHDAVPCNEPNNLYAKKVLALVVQRMRYQKDAGVDEDNRINRVGERPAFAAVMTHEIEELAKEQGFSPERATKRRIDVIWRIMCGFNNGDDIFEEEDEQPVWNPHLADIACKWAKIRLGMTPYYVDEFTAAMKATQLYYQENVTDNRVIGEGPWTLPVVHLLNGHLVAREYTPIAFHQSGERDEQIERTERAAHSNTIWTQGKRALVENREDVIKQLIEIVEDHEGGHPALAGDEPPPQPPAPGPDSGRKRRVCDLSQA